MGYQGGKHIHMPKDTPLANLWLTQANSLGVPLKQFADSQGRLEDVFYQT